MTDEALVKLVDDLRTQSAEKEWFEFKKTKVQPNERLGRYFSALANSAALAHEPFGYLILGVHDETHDVTGTNFDYRTEKVKGQLLWFWTNSFLSPKTNVEPFEVDHPDGRVVVFRVSAAVSQPILFDGRAYVRIDSSTTDLAEHPEKQRALWSLGKDWSAQIAHEASFEDLDPEAVSLAREQYAEKNPSQTERLAGWDDVTFLNKAKVTIKGQITNTALLLLGLEESAALISPAVAKISWLLKTDDNEDQDYEHFGPPFLSNVDRVLSRIRNLTIRTLPSGTLFPKEVQQYDNYVIREALHNAIAHQDYALKGRIQVVETPSRLLLTNVGRFIPQSVERVIEQDAPQDVYRNRFLADAMVSLNMIDTQGGGIKRMYRTQRDRYFPLPTYDLSDPDRIAVGIPGAILDEHYTRLLMQRSDLSLMQVVLLDKVQKGITITHDQHKALKADDLVEGRYPNTIISARIARAIGKQAEHIIVRGFDLPYYRDLVVELVREHAPVSRPQIDSLLLSKLPGRLTSAERKRQVDDIVRYLSAANRITNRGSRRVSSWVLGPMEST